MAITTLPEAPSRSEPSTFAPKADALLGALAQFVTEANALLAQCEQNATTMLSLGTISDALVPPGTLRHWPKSTPPTGWLVRDGSALSRTSYSALFAVIGTTYGAGDGSTTFNLPDDRGMTHVGYKSSDSAFGTFGGTFGSKDAVIVSHTHTVSGNTGTESATHTHTSNIPASSGESGPFGINTVQCSSSISVTSGTESATHTHPFSATTSSQGVSATNTNIQPSRVYLPIIKY